MKRIILNIHRVFGIVFLFLAKDVVAQSSYPYALETVTFNAETKRVDRIPFDKPFRLEVENLSSPAIHKIFIYEMTHKGGVRCFARNYPDIEIPADSVKKVDKKIWFF